MAKYILKINPDINSKLAMIDFLSCVYEEDSAIFPDSISNQYIDLLGLNPDHDWYGTIVAEHLLNPHLISGFKSRLEKFNENDKFSLNNFKYNTDAVCEELEMHYLKLFDDDSLFTLSAISSLLSQHLKLGDEKAIEMILQFLSKFSNVELNAFLYFTEHDDVVDAMFVGSDKATFRLSELVVRGLTSGGVPKEKTKEDKVLDWMFSGDVGNSSKAMAAITVGKVDGFSVPYDLGDLGRCMQLIEAVPEVKASFPDIAKLNDKWASLIANWDELEKLYYSELDPEFGTFPLGSQTRALLRELIS